MPPMRKIAALAGIAALAVPPMALSPAAYAQADAPTLELTYTTYTEGFTVLRLIADLTLTPGGYRIVVHYQTVGTVGFFLPGHDVATADGSWRGDAALPAAFETEGDWGGHPFDVMMDYADGAPEVQRLVPHPGQSARAGAGRAPPAYDRHRFGDGAASAPDDR